MDGIKRIDLLPGAPPMEQMNGNRPQLLGWRVIEAQRGKSRVEWTPTAACSNPIGQVHGGYLGLIVDDVCGMAFASLLTEFLAFPTISMQIEFHRPIQVGETVECRGTVVRIGRKFVVVDTVVMGADRKLRARGTVTFAIDMEGVTGHDGEILAGFTALDA